MTAIEQEALDAALADFDRQAEITLERWRTHLAETHMTTITWKSTPEDFWQWLREYVWRNGDAFDTGHGGFRLDDPTPPRKSYRGELEVVIGGAFCLEGQGAGHPDWPEDEPDVPCAMRFVLLRTPRGEIEITPECWYPQLSDYYLRLIAELRRWAVTPTEAQPTQAERDEDAPERKRGPTERTRLRAEVFKKIKDQHPEWGYEAVASNANEEQETHDYTGETVRNTYNSMGWKWERADRIR